MISKKTLIPFIPPSVAEFLKQKYWTIQEAAFVLTLWPQHNLVKSEILTKHALKVERSYIYLPTKFNSDTKYGENYENMVNSIKEAVDKGLLMCETITMNEVLYFISPCSVIKWALCKDFILPKDLQEAIGICQDTTSLQLKTKTRNLLPMKVKEKIVAQFFLDSDPNQLREELCRNVLKYFDKLIDPKAINKKEKDLTTIRKNLKSLYHSQGKKGPRGKFKKIDDSYTLKPIHEVMKKDPKGKRCYNFFLLNEVMREVAILKIKQMKLNNTWQSYVELSINLGNYVKEWMTDKLVDLYLDKNEYVLDIIKMSFFEVLLSFIHWKTTELCNVALKLNGIDLEFLPPTITRLVKIE